MKGAIRFNGQEIGSGERTRGASARREAGLNSAGGVSVAKGQKAPSLCNLRGNRIGMIFQEPMTALNPLHTISRQIIEPYCLHQHVKRSSPAAKRKLNELYHAVGLSHLEPRGAVYPHQLSGGERQRAMIAMAIANDPDLLIADEPTTALDVTLQQQTLLLLKDLQQTRGMGMLFITHDLLTVRAIADQVNVMQHGRIVEAGTPEEIFENAYHPYTKMLLAAEPHGVAAPLKSDALEIIRTENLSVTFPIKSSILRRTLSTTVAITDASFTLHAGETLGVVGESGSGKSSLGFALLRTGQKHGPNCISRRAFRPARSRSITRRT